ncbi:MAG: hypothetical protein ACD_49C00044G0011 [uncultured bacterium (gcode 4)]|uniref:Uncharacterized protein n=1 Tax=uncultured bacterium (gcode 4) TaxID=1234023 RepID=K2BVW6_9BACT|nr:MAG: hypothetical protein ACD_49C00044G0011 [uncultured bacterium (gcode 4)]
MGAEILELNNVEQPKVPAQNPEAMKFAEATQIREKTQERKEGLNKEIMVYDNAFKEVDSKLILWAKDKISGAIDTKFKDLNLKPEQIENIKLWILWKVINSGIADLLIGGFNKKMKSYSNISTGDVLSKVFNEDEKEIKNNKEGSTDKFLKFFETETDNLKSFITKNKENPVLESFLKSPKNISEFNDKTDLSNYTQVSSEEERKFFQLVKNKIDGYDISLISAEKTKEYVFDLVTKLPEWKLMDEISKFIAFLCTLPFLKDVLKPFLWLKWESEDDMVSELKEQIRLRKSVNALKTYWRKINSKWEMEQSKNDPAISLFKDKDLSKISYENMWWFFKSCDKNKININAKDFWYNVFENKFLKIETKDESWNKIEKTVKLNFNIDDPGDFYESTKWPREKFFEKLNNSIENQPVTIQKAQEAPQNPTPEVLTTTQAMTWLDKSDSLINSYKKRDAQIIDAISKATVFPIWIKYSQKDKNLSYPETIDFDKNSKQIIIWKDKFKVNIPDEQWDAWIKNWKLENIALNWEIVDFTFSWQQSWFSWTRVKQKSREELANIVTILATNWRHTIIDWDSKVEITKTA